MATDTDLLRSSGRPTLARRRPRQTVEQRRESGRQRTRAWRISNDRVGRPEAAEVGKALVLAVASMCKNEIEPGNVTLVDRAIEMLVAAGYQRAHVEQVFRRARRNLSTVTCP